MGRIRSFYERLMRESHEAPWSWLLGPVRWMVIFYKELERDRAFVRAGALAYGTLIALVPVLLLLYAVLEAAGVLVRDERLVEMLIFETFLGDIPEVREVLLPGLERISLGAVGLVSMAGWLWISARIYLTMEESFSDIFRVPVNRPIGRRVLNFYVALTLVPVLLAVTLIGGMQLAQRVGFGAWADTVSLLVPIVLLAGAIRLLPCTRVHWGPALLGGAVGGLLVNVGAWAFGLYVQSFGAVDPLIVIYGSIGLIPVFLLWLYMLWIFVLLGVEVAYVAQNYGSLVAVEKELARGEGDRQHVPSVDIALELLAAVAWSFGRGEAPVEEHALAERCHVPEHRVLEVLEVLRDGGFVVRSLEGWTLTRPAHAIQLKKVADHWRARTTLKREEGEGLPSPVGEAMESCLKGNLAEVIEDWVEPPAEPAEPVEGEGEPVRP